MAGVYAALAEIASKSRQTGKMPTKATAGGSGEPAGPFADRSSRSAVVLLANCVAAC